VVSYGHDFIGYYAHCVLSDGVKKGDFVPRGKPFCTIVDAKLGFMHAHVCLIKAKKSIDPYDYLTQLRVPHGPE
jgi:hypothetical protein